MELAGPALTSPALTSGGGLELRGHTVHGSGKVAVAVAVAHLSHGR